MARVTLALRLLVLRIVLGALTGSAIAAGAAHADMNDPLATRLTPSVVESLFPDADPIEEVAGGPPLAKISRQGEIAGYLFSTHETVRPAGYSGNSFDIIVALSDDGEILGHYLLEEHEPLISPGMIPPSSFRRFLGQLHGMNVKTDRRFAPNSVDAVSGATISAMAMGRAMLDSAILVGHLEGVIDETATGVSLDIYEFAEHDWPELVEEGSIASLTLTNAEVRSAFAAQLGGDAVPDTPFGPDDEPFITLYAAVATPPAIGRNLFGTRAFRHLMRTAKPGEHQLLIASVGPYQWLPKNPWLVPVFDRARIVQNDAVIPLVPENFYRARRLAIADYPPLRNAGRFSLPVDTGFDPVAPWTLELQVFEQAPEGTQPRSVAFALPYRIPAHYVLGDDRALEDAGFKQPTYVGFGLFRESALTDWQHIWIDKRWSVLGLIALLSVVTIVMLLHHRVAQSRKLHSALRISVLAVTLGWLGWVAGAQLTILSIFNYAYLALADVDWRSILFDPLLVILTGYVALSLVLWGRGVFCGWLCPFGALQELLNKLARLVAVPQLTIPASIQARLWLVKYVIAAGLIAIAFISMSTATIAAEIEPFKTAISLHFDRSWPYVLYAGLLLGAGLFVERFFCRFLCPLGAVLAIAGRFHLLDTLKRRPECGNPCHICERSCPIGAIERSGKINMNECHQCLDCQVEYYDDHRCPPLVAERKSKAGLRGPAAPIAPAPARIALQP